MRLLVFLGLLAIVLASAPGDGIEGCTGHESPFDLIDHEPTLVAEVANGRKYTYGKSANIQTMTDVNSTLSPSKEPPMKWESLMALS